MTPTADETCAENIAFLHFLHKVPALPLRNDPGHIPLRHENYVLSFDRERQFAGACAFLSCIKADKTNVSAVCLQEDPERQCLNLLIAVNERGLDANRTYLKQMKSGFERVFQELRQVETANGTDVQERVFEAVITMCSDRILQRLGLLATNDKEGKPIRGVLQKVVDNLGYHQPPPVDAIKQARTVMRLIDAWSKHQVTPRLGDIVDGLRDFTRSPAWRQFATIPSTRDVQKNQIEKLVREMRKLARFRDVATYLYRTAKRYPIARVVHVVTVDLPPTLLERTPLGDYAAHLVSFFNSFDMGKFNLAKVADLLKTNPSSAKTSFASLARTIRKKSRIHAEVQLLVHCDRYLQGLKPRIICSNKQACFLCDLVIKTHGKFYTPYAHGRLYPGWRLPKISGDQLAGQLNIALRDRALDSLGRMKRERKAIGFKYPDESASHTLVISSTALVEPEPTEEVRQGGPVDARVGSNAGAKLPSPQKNDTGKNENRSHTNGTAETYSAPVERSRSALEGDAAPAGIATNTDEVERMLTPGMGQKPPVGGNFKSSCQILRQGKTVSTPLETCRNSSQMFIAKNFDLVVDRAIASASSSGLQHSRKPSVCKLSWLTAEEAGHIPKQKGSSIVEIGTLGEVTLPLDGLTAFFLRDSDGSMLRVSVAVEISERSSKKAQKT